MSLPLNGQVIVFSTVPAGSYCKPEVAYRVERSIDRKTKQPKGSFHFVNMETGGATYDAAWAVKMAVWTLA